MVKHTYSLKNVLAITSTILGGCLTAQAVVLVQMGGGEEMTTGYATFSGTTGTWYDPTDGVFVSPSAAAYVAQPFYGYYGAKFTPTSTGITSVVDATGVANQNTPDYMSVGNKVVPTEDGTAMALMVDLFELASPATAITDMDFTLRGYGLPGATDLRVVAWVDGTDYYITESLSTATGNTDLTSIAWFDYDPATDAWAFGPSSSFDGTGTITGVGILISESVNFTSGGSQAAGIGYSRFIVNGTVPEPSTYALLAGVAMLGFAAWRRRR